MKVKGDIISERLIFCRWKPNQTGEIDNIGLSVGGEIDNIPCNIDYDISPLVC